MAFVMYVHSYGEHIYFESMTLIFLLMRDFIEVLIRMRTNGHEKYSFEVLLYNIRTPDLQIHTYLSSTYTYI